MTECNMSATSAQVAVDGMRPEPSFDRGGGPLGRFAETGGAPCFDLVSEWRALAVCHRRHTGGYRPATGGDGAYLR